MTIAADEFAAFRDYLRERSAIVLEPGKEYLIETRLEPIARREGLANVGALLRRLRQGLPPTLETEVVEALTTNETSFFRDWKPFEALRQKVIPEAMMRRAGERRLDLWCAACSSGQEPYSLAMLLAEHFPALGTWDVEIHACDLSQAMVTRTREGRFSTLEVNRGLPAPLLAKYFRRDGDSWAVSETLRKRLHLSQMNLARPWPTLPAMDVVLIRNVLIYFDLPTKGAILKKVRGLLRPGGALFLGSAETTLGLCDGYSRVEANGTTYFQAA
jgi:chemotaxis protein methyltransferase CheR